MNILFRIWRKYSWKIICEKQNKMHICADYLLHTNDILPNNMGHGHCHSIRNALALHANIFIQFPQSYTFIEEHANPRKQNTINNVDNVAEFKYS